MFAYLKKVNDETYHLIIKYNKKITEMFTANNIYYDNNEQVYVIPSEQYDNIIQQLLTMNVSIKEVETFNPSHSKPKEFIYNIQDDIAIIYFLYSSKVNYFCLNFIMKIF